ncbi:MAG: hypothetical protein CLLPBCKN_004980 [Chroococcidiopsis cubana SAG 39.79]|nr:hypothetical protein [Chroococcidiopsis cubana SAG 39.79]
MNEVPNRSNVIVKFLENDRLALTNRETRCLKVLFNLSIRLVRPVSLPTARWRFTGITVV